MTDTLTLNNRTFVTDVERRTGTAVSACMQCHKCSTGCPVGPEMDLLPSQIMRLIHLGQQDEVLSCGSIWLCATCEACTTRCPMGIDIAAVMDTLRIMAVERGAALPDARGKAFYQSFLGSVKRHGRVFEMEMLTLYKLRTLRFFEDVDKAPKMFLQGKLGLLPNRSGSVKQVREVFRRAAEEESQR